MPLDSPFTPGRPAGARSLDVIGACALDCPDACSWVVTVEDGRAVGLRGNRAHPFTRGGLCAKVNPYLEYAAAPDRLLHPLRRVGAKGEGRFERITWDEALTTVAEAIRSAVQTHGAQSVWPFAGTGTISHLQGLEGSGRRLFNHLGASHHRANICSPAGHAGLRWTMGSSTSFDPADLADGAGLVVLWGTNTLTTNLHLWPFVSRARDRGAPLVVVDPVRTRTAARADLHVAPRPGTDGALALGVMHALHARGGCDETFLADRTLGWPAFRDEVLARWTPERAAAVSGVPVGQVEEFAALVADHRPLAVRTLMGVQRHPTAAQAVRVLSCLPALTGDLARPGAGLCYSTSADYGIDEHALTRPDLLPGPVRTLVMSRLGRELLERDDPPVAVLAVWAANPVVSNPDANRVRQGLAREDLFTVVVDHRLTETAAYADVVLPGTAQHEHDDLVASYSHLVLNWNARAVEPPGECLSHTEIFRRLARALGVTEPAVLADDDELVRDALGSSAGMAGITLESLRRNGFEPVRVPRPYVPFAVRFPTPSGRFEFTSTTAQAAGQGLLPDHAETAGPGGDDVADGLVLVSAANHYLLNSTFNASPRHTRAGVPQVTVHPQDAAALGLTAGDAVDVTSDRGSFAATVVVSDSVRRGVAATSKGLRPRGGTSVNTTTSDALSDAGGGATFHDNRVRITPTLPS